MHIPKASLANPHELSTVSNAHHAVELANAQSIHLNTDGTTFNQTNVQGTLLNGMVTGVSGGSRGGGGIQGCKGTPLLPGSNR